MLTCNRPHLLLRRVWPALWIAGIIGASDGFTAATPPNAGLSPVTTPSLSVVKTGSGPRIHVSQPIHDFGKVPSGEQRVHEFLVENVGSAPLEISHVRTSCGCTTTGQWDRRIEPGSTGRIPIRFDTGNFSGALQRTVTLVTNDPDNNQLVMQVKAQIWTPVEVTPKTVMFQYDREATEGQTNTVRLLSHLDEPLQFNPVTTSHPSFAASLKTVVPGKEFALEIRTVPPVGTGMITAPLVLQPVTTNLQPVQVMVYAIETQPVTVSPASLMLPVGPARTGTRPGVTIRNNTSHPFELSDPQVNVPGATVQVVELQANRLFRLTPIFPEDYELPTGEQVELTVKSNHPRYPEIRVPVTTARQAIRTTPTARPALSAAPAPRTNVVVRPAPRPPAVVQPPPVPAGP
jgi:hypothetical protein